MITEVQPEVLAGVTVRRATAADREALLAFYRGFEPKGAALSLPPVRKEATVQWLASLERFANFLAFEGGRLVGHGVVCRDGGTAEVAVFVQQALRGRGIGRRLLHELIAEARWLGLWRIWGIAAADNVPMLRLAWSCGFVPGEEPGEFYLDLQPSAHRCGPQANAA